MMINCTARLQLISFLATFLIHFPQDPRRHSSTNPRGIKGILLQTNKTPRYTVGCKLFVCTHRQEKCTDRHFVICRVNKSRINFPLRLFCERGLAVFYYVALLLLNAGLRWMCV